MLNNLRKKNCVVIKKIKGKDYSDEIAHALIYRPREKSTMQKNNQFNSSMDNICQRSILIMEKNIQLKLRLEKLKNKTL